MMEDDNWEIKISVNSGDLSASEFFDKIVELAESLGMTIAGVVKNANPTEDT